MDKRWSALLGTLLVAGLVGAPWLYWTQQQAQFRNLRVVAPGVLYRSGQLNAAGLRTVVHEQGIRTIITLRDAEVPGQTPPDAAEEAWCRAQGLRYVRITPRPWSRDEAGTIPAAQNVQEFLRVLDEPANYPVLVHCFAGIHRTGAHCAVFRMEYDRWPCARALAEMQRIGYANLNSEPDVRMFLQNYHPRWRPADSEEPTNVESTTP